MRETIREGWIEDITSCEREYPKLKEFSFNISLMIRSRKNREYRLSKRFRVKLRDLYLAGSHY